MIVGILIFDREVLGYYLGKGALKTKMLQLIKKQRKHIKKVSTEVFFITVTI